MTERAVDSLAQSIGVHHRRTLLTLGVGGLAAALAGTAATSAKLSSGKMRKKRCKRQQQSCINQVRTYCAGKGDNAPFCEEDVLPCCETCDVGAGIICIVDGFNTLE
jgi:hypothetical protein